MRRTSLQLYARIRRPYTAFHFSRQIGSPHHARWLRTHRRQAGERGNEAYARHLLAKIHGAPGTIPASTTERDYVDALALAAELGMRPLAARCHAGLGLLILRTGRRDEAQHHLDTAVEMFREMAMRFWLDKLEVDRAELC